MDCFGVVKIKILSIADAKKEKERETINGFLV